MALSDNSLHTRTCKSFVTVNVHCQCDKMQHQQGDEALGKLSSDDFGSMRHEDLP